MATIKDKGKLSDRKSASCAIALLAASAEFARFLLEFFLSLPKLTFLILERT